MRVYYVIQDYVLWTPDLILSSVLFAGPSVLPYMVTKQIKMEGFLVNRWIPMWPEAFQKMDQLIQEVSCVFLYKAHTQYGCISLL